MSKTCLRDTSKTFKTSRISFRCLCLLDIYVVLGYEYKKYMYVNIIIKTETFEINNVKYLYISTYQSCYNMSKSWLS